MWTQSVSETMGGVALLGIHLGCPTKCYLNYAQGNGCTPECAVTDPTPIVKLVETAGSSNW